MARSRAVLAARRDAGGGLALVTLAVDPARALAYTTPGQYVEVHTPLGEGYFVLASAIGGRTWELLVKPAAGAAEALVSSPLGASFEVDGPLGAGFPFERMRGRPVVVAVVASALGVARAVLAQRVAQGAAPSTHVLIGLRSARELPIEQEVRGWTERGVPVVLCLSRSELHHEPEVVPRAGRVVGYVQHALVKALENGTVPHGSLVVAAGPEGMLADLAALGARAGPAGSASRPSGPSIEVLTNV